MNAEFTKVKDELGKIPNLVWWVGAGVVAIVFILRRMQGTSSSSSTTPADTTSAYDTTTSATGTDTTGLSGQLSDVETMLQSLINNQNPVNAVTTPTATNGVTSPVPVSTSPIGDIANTITDWATPALSQAQRAGALSQAQSSAANNFQEVAGPLPATSSSPIDKLLSTVNATPTNPLVVYNNTQQNTSPLIGSQAQQTAFNNGSLLFVQTTPSGQAYGYAGNTNPSNSANFTKAAAGAGAVLKTDANGSYYQATNGQQFRL